MTNEMVFAMCIAGTIGGITLICTSWWCIRSELEDRRHHQRCMAELKIKERVDLAEIRMKERTQLYELSGTLVIPEDLKEGTENLGGDEDGE